MPHRLSCPRGHFWESSAPLPSPVDGLATCPVCGVPCLAPTVVTDYAGQLTQGYEPAAAPSSPLPSLPGYEILGRLGEGAMGLVFKARHLRLGRLVAVKVIAGAGPAQARQLARFQLEAEALATLHHPNIVQIYDVGDHNQTPYLAMEFVDGGTLAERLHAGPQPPAQAARLVETLARAVHAAHQYGIVHRDLKPSNILLSRDEQKAGPAPDGCVPKISDFGLAMRLEQQSAGETGAILGTPFYMSPEQASGNPAGAVGTLADVHALGVILYEMLTGHLPFRGNSVLETLERVRTAEPTPPRRLHPSVPRDLEVICLKCLRKEPRQRYPGALALAEDLTRFLRHEPIQARPVPASERFVLWIRRRPAEAGLLAVSVLAGVSLLALGLWSNARLRESSARAEARSRLARRAVDDMYTRVAEKWLANEPEMDLLQREFLEKALAVYQDLAGESSADPGVRREQGLAFFRVGQICRELGQHDRAEEAYRRALSVQERLLSESTGSAVDRRNLANTRNWLGELLRVRGGRLAEAEREYREALGLQRQLATDFPGEVEYRKELARSHYNLGIVRMEADRPGEAEEAYGQAIRLLRPLAGREEEYRHELARSYLNRGVLRSRQSGPTPEAEEDCVTAVRLLKGLAEQFPSRPRYRYELAIAGTNRANLLLRVPSRIKEAEAALGNASDLFARLAADFPGKPRYRYELANCRNSLASVYASSAERRREAEKTWRQTIDTFTALVEQFPDVADYRYGLGRSYANLGWLHLLRDEPAPACEQLGRGREHLHAARKLHPTHPAYQQALRDLCQNLAEGRVLLGEHTRAIEAVRELLEVGPPDHYLAACFAARCLALARADGRLGCVWQSVRGVEYG